MGYEQYSYPIVIVKTATRFAGIVQTKSAANIRSDKPRNIVKEAARHLNTATSRLAVFPLRVLYRCTLLGHRETYGRKNTAKTIGSGYR